MITEDMPLLKNSPKAQKAKTSAGKQWKAAPLKPSATTAAKKLNKVVKSKKPTPVKPEVLKKPIAPRVARILEILKNTYPDAHCSLEFSNPLELLIATILSAQCTDERVNKTTPAVFARYKNVQDFAAADPLVLEQLIRSTGFYRNKTKNIIACCQQLIEKHDGEVPRTMEELSVLPGVGRKTANVLLGNAFGIPGMVVDTHVGRLSLRLGLSFGKNPVEIEHDLEKIIPRENWVDLSHWLIYHGRAICDARKPMCTQCPLLKDCPQIL
jgi:endonuclease-3